MTISDRPLSIIKYMTHVWAIFVLSVFSVHDTLAGFGVELDIVFRDSIQDYRFLYVLGNDPQSGTNDTIAVFDSLSFNQQHRTSLFYTAPQKQENWLSFMDANGENLESKTFVVSPLRTTFAVVVGSHQIKVAPKDFLHPQKDEDERSYFSFLFIFFLVKLLIAVLFIFSNKLPKRLISIASGAFLLSGFIDWYVPLHYFFRFLMVLVLEFLLISLVGRKSISWLQSLLLVIIVNVIGFGIISGIYLLYVFW